MNTNMFVKSISFDESKRIIVSLQETAMVYLQDPQMRTLLKQSAESVLKDDFKLLEIGKNNCRLTVIEGTEDKNMVIVKEELVKGLEMAMSFMTQMGN